MTDLPTRTLGRTGVEVTTLGYGAMELRGDPRGPELTDRDAERVLNEVLDAGIIVGTSNLEHLRDNIRAAKNGPLPTEVVQRAKRRLAEVGALSEAVPA